MKALIVAIAPTQYQYQSVLAFGMPTKNLINGSIIGYKDFDSMIEAKVYFKELANEYYGNDKKKKQFNYNSKSLTIDGADATIECNEERERWLKTLNLK